VFKTFGSEIFYLCFLGREVIRPPRDKLIGSLTSSFFSYFLVVQNDFVEGKTYSRIGRPGLNLDLGIN
jgi:hypothetical protein